MRRRLLASLSLVLLTGGSVSVASAQTPPPPPPSIGAGVNEGFAPGSDRFNFQLRESLDGYGFKQGEQITISADQPGIAPVTVTAGQGGIFNVPVSFHWLFCGARGASQPHPTFTAKGNQGDLAQTHPLQEPCPELNSTALAQVATGSAGPVAFSIQAFGFAPGEKVALREIHAGSYKSTKPVTATADSMGRLQTKLSVYVPPTCALWKPYPAITAIGNRGTSVVYPLNWFDPTSINCMNPNPKAPPPHYGPSGIQGSLRLLSTRVARGGVERAVLQINQVSTGNALVISYPGKKQARVSFKATDIKNGHYTLHWKVPRNVKAGTARVQVAVPKKTALQATFHVR